MAENLKVHLFQCSALSEPSGSGSLVLTAGAGGAYTAKASIDFAGVGKITEDLSGSSVAAGGRNLIVLGSGANKIQVTLVDNPYIGRPTYGGCASLNGAYIYNITATP